MVERRTPFYDIHVRLGAQMIKGGGDYMFPVSYTTPAEEHMNTRSNVGMQDLSTMGKVDIKGPDAEALANKLLVNDVRRMSVGQVLYSTMCKEDGGVLDDVTIYKFNHEHFLIVTGSGNRMKVTRWVTDHAKGIRAYVTDITTALALPVIQGPRSRDYLKSVVQEGALDNLRYFWFTRGRIGETEMIISRTGFTGELGYELYIPADEAAVTWDYIMDTGREFGLKPYGVAAMRTLGLEKGYVVYGADVNESLTPWHAGLDKWVKFDKGDFLGREALLKMKEKGVTEQLTGLIINGEKAASLKDPVFSGDKEVGYVTYSNKGHTVGAILALAYVKTPYGNPGTPLHVRIGGILIPAKVSITPFFDPKGVRLHS